MTRQNVRMSYLRMHGYGWQLKIFFILIFMLILPRCNNNSSLIWKKKKNRPCIGRERNTEDVCTGETAAADTSSICTVHKTSGINEAVLSFPHDSMCLKLQKKFLREQMGLKEGEVNAPQRCFQSSSSIKGSTRRAGNMKSVEHEVSVGGDAWWGALQQL